MKKPIALLMLVLTISISCRHNKKEQQVNQEKNKEVQTEHTSIKDKDCNNIHWGYENNEEGPENWKNLCEGFSACGGQAQSPVNIESKNLEKSDKLRPINFKYNTSNVDIINNGHTVQFNVTGDNKIKIKDKNYKLLQFHFHTLSEHTVNGKHYPAEMHLVHKNNEKDYAVIGVMFKEGKENELLKKYLDKFPSKNENYKTDEDFDLNVLLPKDKNYYYYSGSLTTPPCSEIVNWYVLKNPIEASKEQIQKLSKILHNNYRPVQKLNGRKIYTSEN